MSGKSTEVKEGGGGSCRNLYRSLAKRTVPRNAFLSFLNLYIPLGGKFLKVKCVVEHILFSSIVTAVIELHLPIWIMWQYSVGNTKCPKE